MNLGLVRWTCACCSASGTEPREHATAVLIEHFRAEHSVIDAESREAVGARS